MKRQTIAECLGGACDGLQLDPSSCDDPDDWADVIQVVDKRTGVIEDYQLRYGPPRICGGFRIYFYDLIQ